jgi:hypothetical protein
MSQLRLPFCFALLRCIPQRMGKHEYGHVWTSNAPEAICQCGKQRYGEP